MPKFQIGEIALAVSSVHGIRECEILSSPYKSRGKLRYLIHIPTIWSPAPDGNWQVAEHQLRKLPPKDDPASWEDLKDIWQPEGIQSCLS